MKVLKLDSGTLEFWGPGAVAWLVIQPCLRYAKTHTLIIRLDCFFLFHFNELLSNLEMRVVIQRSGTRL